MYDLLEVAPRRSATLSSGNGVRQELIQIAATFAQTHGLRRLNATSLARTSGINRRLVTQIFPTRSLLLESVWNFYLCNAEISNPSWGNAQFRSRRESAVAKLPVAAKEWGSGISSRNIELTLDDLLADPLVALVNKADYVNWRSYAQLLQSAARVYARSLQSEKASVSDPVQADRFCSLTDA